ncbi:Protein of unknown function [Izhakiella capsodis]|uniref:DUF1454 domain-containing protein n=1 Tax=Izhakiella capsodis TaxID=1367852 RepID=A0A1I5ABD0_9GAMM|nr:DUF1454 family protein [Izhakiella capsodis]SFN59774.1 Protein of unknown function [Izhakiella capsodis]
MNNLLRTGLIAVSILISGLCHADPQEQSAQMPMAAYLLTGAPTFDMTIGQFREKYNASNPSLPLSEYRAIDNRSDKSNLTRAASKINENLYSSTALERGTGKIKTLQITWLPVQGPEQKTAYDKALAYMAAFVRYFEPMLNEEQSLNRVTTLLAEGKGQRYVAKNEGALRYVVADNGEKGITLAIEPLKLVLAPDNQTK